MIFNEYFDSLRIMIIFDEMTELGVRSSIDGKHWISIEISCISVQIRLIIDRCSSWTKILSIDPVKWGNVSEHKKKQRKHILKCSWTHYNLTEYVFKCVKTHNTMVAKCYPYLTFTTFRWLPTTGSPNFTAKAAYVARINVRWYCGDRSEECNDNSDGRTHFDKRAIQWRLETERW